MPGLNVPLASAISQSVPFTDMLVWAVIALLVQILVFLALRTSFPGLCGS